MNDKSHVTKGNSMIQESIPHKAIQPAEDTLRELFPDPPVFSSLAEIEAMTDDQAMEVMRAARRMLVMQLLFQEYHEHLLDDCGDYLAAATNNWAELHEAYFVNDGQDFTAFVRTWLLDVDGYGGCDGEVRYDMLPEAVVDSLLSLKGR